LAVAAASQGSAVVVVAVLSTDAFELDCDALLPDAELEVAASATGDVDAPLLSPLHAASPTAVASQTATNPILLDIMTPPVEPLIGREYLVVRIEIKNRFDRGLLHKTAGAVGAAHRVGNNISQ
jgi:hypothetical protein